MTELICEKDIRSQKAMVESRDIYNLCNNLLLCLTNGMQHMHAIFKLEAQWYSNKRLSGIQTRGSVVFKLEAQWYSNKRLSGIQTRSSVVFKQEAQWYSNKRLSGIQIRGSVVFKLEAQWYSN